MPAIETHQALPIVAGYNTGERGVRVFIGPTDPISDIPITLDLAHHQLHEGESHQVTIAPAALALNNSIDLRLVVGNLTPTTRTPHVTIEADAPPKPGCICMRRPPPRATARHKRPTIATATAPPCLTWPSI